VNSSCIDVPSVAEIGVSAPRPAYGGPVSRQLLGGYTRATSEVLHGKMATCSDCVPLDGRLGRLIDRDDGHREDGIQFQLLYGVAANTRNAWSIANARRIIGYEPQDDSEVVYADEIRE
jgi:hypothetical protein